MSANIRSACERAYCLDRGVNTKPGDVFRCQHGKVYVLRAEGLGRDRWHSLNPVRDPIDYWRALRAIAAEALAGDPR